jgi:hypothetical protein
MLLVFAYLRGEILKLYVSDVNLKGRSPSIRLVRRPGDLRDPRPQEPAVKTLGREIPLSQTIARLLDVFIQYHRPNFSRSDESPFLLFSADGQPLSLRMVNAITDQIVKRYPEFSGKLTPHVLRYTCNDMLQETAQQDGIDSEAFKQMQNYLNGWRIGSENLTDDAKGKGASGRPARLKVPTRRPEAHRSPTINGNFQLVAADATGNIYAMVQSLNVITMQRSCSVKTFNQTGTQTAITALTFCPSAMAVH